MMPHMQALADNRDIPAETQAPMIRALENHQRDLSARKYVTDYLDAAERHMGNHAALQRTAEGLDIPIAEVSDHPDWRQEADRLVVSGEAILSDKEAHGVHLDHILIGDTRLKWALSDLREAIRRDSAAIRENAVVETQERPSPVPTPEESAREAQSKVHEFRRLQSAAYHASGDERKAARKAFDEYRARESKNYTTPGEDRRHARDIHEETRQQPSSPQTDEERRREAQSKAHEFRRLQSAAYNATGDERIAAQKAFDDYREREFKKNEKHEEKKTPDPQEVQRPENAPAVSRAVGWTGAHSPRHHGQWRVLTASNAARVVILSADFQSGGSQPNGKRPMRSLAEGTFGTGQPSTRRMILTTSVVCSCYVRLNTEGRLLAAFHRSAHRTRPAALRLQGTRRISKPRRRPYRGQA